jgi:hypothetical protein
LNEEEHEMRVLIVEYKHEPPITDEQLKEASAKLHDCLEARSAKWIQTYLSEDRTSQICIFEAPDAEAVRSAYRMAGVKFERVRAAFTPFS